MGARRFYLQHRGTGHVVCAFDRRDEAEVLAKFLNYMTGRRTTFGVYIEATKGKEPVEVLDDCPTCGRGPGGTP
jgi:hypothetical protein